ncbi:hypothetical protein DFJ63DRAFT_333653 [Scheffersomyces coipomensis]|uniref:uncharacterized protein n=1 Tax=Scheffersomyces coipomensis TaxID=1788519 RepID=UPI00315CE2DD
MSFFNIFSSSLNTAATIPQYKQGKNQDSIDLQLKSLLYVFKRLRINKLSSFLAKDYSLKYIDEGISFLNEIDEGDTESGEESEAYYQKLDQLYNIDEFKSILIEDEYRVMVDYIKNKFRSYCLVSNYPSSNFSRPSSPVKGSTNNQNNEYDDEYYPSFKDAKDRKTKGFRFILLPIRDISVEFIANTLSMSDIYSEHFHSFLDFNKRYQYAMEAIHRVIDDSRYQDKIKSIDISEDEKAAIIQHYLHTAAFNIQLNRIYDEYLKKFPIVKSAIPTTSTTPISSPIKLRTTAKPLVSISLNTSPSKQQPPKVLSKRPSIADLRISSPSKQASPQKSLRVKPSISKLRLDEMNNNTNIHNHFLESNLSSSKSDISSTISDTDDENESPPSSITHKSNQSKSTTEFRMDVYEKCKLAIIDKLNTERSKLVV